MTVLSVWLPYRYRMIHLATGIALHKGRLLLVASRYPNHQLPLWNLPGGRQLPGELLEETIVREVLEETGITVEPREVAYVSESYDGAEHFLNVTFLLEVVGEHPFDSPRCARFAQDDTRDPGCFAQDDTGDRGCSARDDAAAGAGGDHVVAVEWVPIDALAERTTIAVVREPLIAFLRGELPRRYAGFHNAGVTIEWPEDSQ